MAINITKTDTLVDQQVVEEIFSLVAKNSKVLPLMTRLKDATGTSTKLKVESLLPIAYFQETSTSHKKTSKMAWENKYIYLEELAVIIPIAEADLEDAQANGYDIVANIKDKVASAFYKKIDAAILNGDSKPTTWEDGIVNQAKTKGHEVTATADFYQDISDAMGYVEDSGYIPNQIVGGTSLRKKFRDLRDKNGNPISANNEVSATDRTYVDNGAWDSSKAVAVVGDFSQAVYQVRTALEVKLLTEATIKDPETETEINLAQQDMVALRFRMRIGWALPNPVSPIESEAGVSFPFAAVVPAQQ